MTTRWRPCIDCEAPVYAKGPTGPVASRCPSCKREHRRQWFRAYRGATVRPGPPPPRPEPAWCTWCGSWRAPDNLTDGRCNVSQRGSTCVEQYTRVAVLIEVGAFPSLAIDGDRIRCVGEREAVAV